MATRKASRGVTVAVNRRARYDYELLETFDAGIVLIGSEIKSLREGKASIAEGYARLRDGELWLYNVHVAHYPPARESHDPTRSRKLLLHKNEIAELASEVAEKRLTIIPLRMDIKNHVAKVEIALARGKRQYDKRRAIIDKEMDLAARRALRREE